MSVRARLRAIVEDLPEGAAVTFDRSALEELLDAEAPEPEPVSDLTVREVADELDRAPSTVRGWLGSGDLDGYRLRGNEWRVPRDALRAFLDGERNGTEPEESADLGSWREVRHDRR